MSNWLQQLARPRTGLLGGCLLGLVLAGTRHGLCSAEVTLFFPPALTLQQPPVRDEPTPQLVSSPTPRVDPVVWAQDLLLSKEAVDVVCKRIERLDIEAKSQVLRSAVLLSEDKRIRVETLPSSCVRLEVSAETPKVAVLLCEGLLAYLNFKTKIPLEDPDPDKLVSSERQLRVQEKALSRSLWGLMAFDSPKDKESMDLQAVELELQDYQASVAQYRKAMWDHFFREPRHAAVGPSFTILEPPAPTRSGRPWLAYGVAGAILGAAVSKLAERLSRRRSVRKNVPWRIQERAPRDRTGSPDYVKD